MSVAYRAWQLGRLVRWRRVRLDDKVAHNVVGAISGLPTDIGMSLVVPLYNSWTPKPKRYDKNDTMTQESLRWKVTPRLADDKWKCEGLLAFDVAVLERIGNVYARTGCSHLERSKWLKPSVLTYRLGSNTV
jgi:hypothetical protein